MQAVVYLPGAGVETIPEVVAMNRAEVWATFILMIVGALVLLTFMGFVVGGWFDHAFGVLFHTLSSPLLATR